jgi:hypothetical protein
MKTVQAFLLTLMLLTPTLTLAGAWTPEQTATLRQEISARGYRCDVMTGVALVSFSERGSTWEITCDQGRRFRLIMMSDQSRFISPW